MEGNSLAAEEKRSGGRRRKKQKSTRRGRDFTLAHVLDEVTAWLTSGRSRFRQLLGSQNLPPPESSPGRVSSPLNTLLPATKD